MIGLWLTVAWAQPADVRPPDPPPPAAAIGTPWVTFAKRRETMLDVEVRVGLGAALTSAGGEVSGGLRLAPGIWHDRNRAVWSLTASYALTDLSPATFGAQIGWMHATAPALFFVQLGGLVDIHGHPGVSALVGWGAVGVEVQVRDLPDRGRTTVILATMRTAVGRMRREFGGPSRIR